ncbi:MAG: TauD/TfdA family dioxygenase, partial [Pseudomonadota bacterium]
MTDRASAQIPEVPLNAEAVASAAQTHGVVRVTSGGLVVQGFAAFMEQLGEPMFTEGETPVPGFPNLNIVTNVGRTTKPKSVFHSDTTYVRQPPKFSGLFAVDVPASGGATLFTDQYAAFDALPASLRQLLLGATMLHAVTGL